ncbi:hypothetical protein [Cytobacillus oceanisediminis]|uniref:hypothetical protein n=1 Tax=Cytobacillus oceanisediminis TaxID=665099 RepID=UPI0020799F51|nr:hypothetical protein [Cytobacillus oceanisediminis]USK43763.1 hypothetical protein LIT27_24815 [Cytobacillus oceanisediminis]
MVRQAVYYDVIDEKTYPYWYGIRFDEGEVDWQKETFYFEVSAPFERIRSSDLDNSLLSVSVDSADIVKSLDHPSKLGISLNRIKKRVLEHDADVREIKQFIILVADIEEFLYSSRWER